MFGLLDGNVWRVTIIIQLDVYRWFTKKNVAKTIMFDLLDIIRKLLSQIIIGVRIIRWFGLMDELRYIIIDIDDCAPAGQY